MKENPGTRQTGEEARWRSRLVEGSPERARTVSDVGCQWASKMAHTGTVPAEGAQRPERGPSRCGDAETQAATRSRPYDGAMMDQYVTRRKLHGGLSCENDLCT